MGVRRRSVLIGIGALAALLGLCAPAAAARPNVVVIVTDDQTLESFRPETMPEAHRGLVARGTRFTEAIVATPQCCPSRAGLLTGQYPQNNHVIANRPGYSLLRHKRRVLPRWLQRAGYRTIHIGKYLNGYLAARGARAGPGWDRWKTITEADYDNPVFAVDREFRDRSGRYLTALLNRMAERAVRAAAKRRQPFYLQLDHLAPHTGSGAEQGGCQGAAIPADRDEGSFADVQPPQNPAVGEDDVSDKPEFIRREPQPDAGQRREAQRFYRCALESLRAVDRGIGRVLGALREAGELRRTMVVFTSDNGFAYGEHRMHLTKGLPYEEHLRVPLVIRPPRGRRISPAARRGLELGAPVANVDLAPTILRLARAGTCGPKGRRCRRMDGRSLLPLLRGEHRGWTETRAIRIGFAIDRAGYRRSCRWDGLRTPDHLVVEHTELPIPGGTRCEPAARWEYYELRTDPFQLEGDGPIPGALDDRVARLRQCSGIPGRDPPMPNKPYCE